jgi:hypothetical protein
MNCNNILPTLSNDATNEAEVIIGEDLAFVIAFGLKGEIKLIFRNGVEINPEDWQISDPLGLIDVTFNFPHNPYINCCDISFAQKLLMFYRLCPQPGGGIGPCRGPCPQN